MSFPQTPLTLLVELAFGADVTADPAGWSWTDVTTYVRLGDAGRIQIVRGRADQASLADTSKLTMTVDNTDGRWSTRNPTGPWYGQIRKGVPIRVSAEGHVRYTGFISVLSPRWDLSENDRWVDVEAQGLLYRLTQGATPEKSPLRWTIDSVTPTAYWSLDDGPDSTSGTLSGGAGGSFIGLETSPWGGQIVVPGRDEVASWLGFGLTIAGPGQGLAYAPVALPAPTTLTIDATFRWDFDTDATFGNEFIEVELLDDIDPFSTTQTGLVMSASRDATTGIVTASNVWLVNGSSVGGSGGPYGVVEAGVHHVRAVVNALTIDFFFDGVSQGAGLMNGPLSAAPNVVLVHGGNGVDSDLGTAIFRDITIWVDATAPGVEDCAAAATVGYAGEQGHERFERLTAEQNIPATTTGTVSQTMGVQGIAKFLDLERECEASDQGFLYEGLAFDLVFQTFDERCNQTAALELDYATSGHIAPPLEATDDDRYAINDVTVQRSDSDTFFHVTEEDPDVELSIPNIGRRDESLTLSLETEAQTPLLATWRLRLGTTAGYRYPTISLDLAAGPSLIADWCATSLGARVTVDNVPADLGPNLVDLILEGYTESLNFFDWDVEINLSSNDPHRVQKLTNTPPDDDVLDGWLIPDHFALRAAQNSSSTSWTVDCLPRMTADADDLPCRVSVAGEEVAVTAVATTAITHVADGTAAHANNANVTPSLPAGTQGEDLLLLLAAIRNSGGGVPQAPTGYTRTKFFDASSNVQIFARIAGGAAGGATSDSNPTVTFTGGAANADTSAQITAFRGVPITLDDLEDIVISASPQLNASAQDIRLPMLMRTVYTGQLAIAAAWKQDDWTSVAPPTGFTEIGEPDTTTGDDQGITWAYRIDTTPADVDHGLSFVVTGGGAAISRSTVGFIYGGYQTHTVTRSVNGVVKSQTAAAQIELLDPLVLSL